MRSRERLADAIAAAGAEAVAVCLLHSYMNAAHEARVRELLHGASRQHSCQPVIRGAAGIARIRAGLDDRRQRVRPAGDRRVSSAASSTALKQRGVNRRSSSCCPKGGMASPDVGAALRRAHLRVRSRGRGGHCGKRRASMQAAAGAFLRYGRHNGEDRLIHDGAPEITMDFEVARTYRFKKGSGLPLRVPVVDLIEIGAGGGSIVAHR